MTVTPNKQVLNNEECETEIITLKKQKIGTDYSYSHEIVWKNAIGFLILHIVALCGLFYLLIGVYKFATILWGITFIYISSEGMTVGAHRYYAHRSFKANLPLQVLLLLMQTTAGQGSIFNWVRDHHLHHRYSDTDGDPKNSKRGFFFSHIGWLMSKKHPYVIELGRKTDMSDLLSDRVVMFQKKYYYYLYFLTAVLIPVYIPVYFWNENWTATILIVYFVKHVLQLNGTWLVNSAAHSWGTRPYDKNLQPVESWFVSFISLGEGWHNYHHAFPWDYKAAESSMPFNFSAALIRFFEAIGQAYDLKTASPEMVEKRIKRTGDGTHFKFGNKKARSSMKAIVGPVHPMNPFYTTKMKDPEVELKTEGLPFHDKDLPNIEASKKIQKSNCLFT